MPILKHVHKCNFTILPNSLIRDPALSLRSVGLLALMLSLPDEWDFSVSGLEEIAPHDGRAAINTAIREIENAGYLRRAGQSRGADGKIGGAVWYIYDAPTVDRFPVDGSPVDGKPATNKIKTNQEKTNQENIYKPISGQNSTPFINPPTLEEVEKYIQETGSSINPVGFYNCYESRKWMCGKKPVDWKACVDKAEENGFPEYYDADVEDDE